MAISKILHMKDCGSSFHGKHLKSALEYITVQEKTQNGRLVSAINCQVDNAFEQMKETKKKFNKTDKRQAYHIILSFKEGEVSPDTVFELTERFVKEYLGNDYEAVFAVHDNTEHPHSHIVFNSVSFRDGKKYHYQKGDWEKYIQPITNRLCKEYGLSTIKLDEESGKRRGRDSYQEWNSYRDGKFVWSRMVARDVDACIIQAASFPAGAIPVYANAGGIPVYYTMTLVQDKQVLQRTDIDYMRRKPSVFEGIMSKFAFKKKSHKDLVQLVINKELSPEQVNAIRGGLESGLDEEQLELIINKNLTPEKMQSIIRFAALQNSLKAERGGV